MTYQAPEPTQPNIFHIHIDAQRMPETLSRDVRDQLGFSDTNFSGHPPGFAHFEPTQHLTLKVNTRDEFFSIWSKLEAMISREDFVGYLEGEYIPVDDFIPYKDFVDVPVPFLIHRRRLSGADRETFRQSELHLVYKKEGSDPRLTERLLQAGLYGAYIPKKDGDFVVLTMQGYLKDIGRLAEVLKQYVEEAGGALRCTLKEERAIKHKLFGIGSTDLPEIADHVEYDEVTTKS
jgi:hypothetical protein